MKRIYTSGEQTDVTYFYGNEVEHTPAFGKYTMFVVGVQNVDEIALQKTNGQASVEHIFFGANHSFNPKNNLDWQRWESMITYFLDKGYLCSLDIPMSAVEEFHENNLNDYQNFIPQIRVPIPYIKLWNYNTMIKIDDKDFDATNPGVWTHSLHNLKDRSKFTSWDAYSNDEIIK
jgi:hypothetical protein